MASTPTRDTPLRGEVWDVDLDPVRGHEQGGHRPALVLSVDRFNLSPAGLTVVAPFTRRDKGIRMHVRILPPEGGLREVSYLKPEDIRGVSLERLGRRWGALSPALMAEVETRLRYLLGL